MVDQVKQTFKLNSRISKDKTELIAEEVLDYIIERTKSGKGKDGKSFPSYSDSYKNSINYKAARKDGTPNLTLSGEMIDSLKVLEVKNGSFTIGFSKSDKEVNARAEGNILGSYGGSPNKSKARNFLEMSSSEIAKIIRNIDMLPTDVQKEISKLARDGAIELISTLDFEIEDEE